MKFTLSILTLLLSTIVAADGLSVLGSQGALGDDDAVPGDNPLKYCREDHQDDLLVLQEVNLTPNPPVAGGNLTIQAVGELRVDIKEGAYMDLQINYGSIRLVDRKMDLCEQVSRVDLKCPIKKGKITIIKDFELPKQIPPGTYTVSADTLTAHAANNIVCLTATVTFGS